MFICLFLLLFPLPEEADQKKNGKTNVEECTAYVIFYDFYGFQVLYLGIEYIMI